MHEIRETGIGLFLGCRSPVVISASSSVSFFPLFVGNLCVFFSFRLSGSSVPLRRFPRSCCIRVAVGVVLVAAPLQPPFHDGFRSVKKPGPAGESLKQCYCVQGIGERCGKDSFENQAKPRRHLVRF